MKIGGCGCVGHTEFFFYQSKRVLRKVELRSYRRYRDVVVAVVPLRGTGFGFFFHFKNKEIDDD